MRIQLARRVLVLFLSCLGLFLSPAAWSATEFSQNIVGYVNVMVEPGYNLISNPLVPNTTNLNEVLPLPDAADGAVLMRFDAEAQQYRNCFVWIAGTGWRGAGVTTPSYSIPPGESFFIHPRPSLESYFTITLVGDVRRGVVSLPLNTGGNLFGSPSVKEALLADLNFPAANNDYIYPPPAHHHAGFWYIDGFGWDPDTPFLQLAKGLAFRRAGSNTTWTSSFTEAGLDTVTGPRLRIARSGTNVVLAWPDSFTGFQLEETTLVTPPSWSNVPGSPVTIGNELTTTLPAAGSRKYFRLRN